MSRYEYDIRRPMRRRDDSGGSAWGVFIVCLLIIGIFALIGWAVLKQTNEAATAMPTSIAKVRTDDGSSIRIYSVTIDNTEYLVNDRGGMCERGV